MGALQRSEADQVVDSWTRYLNEIGRVPLLEPAEVTELAHAIEVGVLARDRLDAEPDAATAADLRILVEEGDNAHRHLISANLRLVVAVAKRTRSRGVPLPDLVQEGAFGLIRAVQKYDHRKGFAFSTYATWWIRQAVNRAVAELCRPVRVPVHAQDEVIVWARARDRIADRTGREASVTEIASAAGLELARTAVLLRAASPAASLQQILPGGIIDDALAVDPPDPAPELDADDLRERLDVALQQLPEQHRQVLTARVGWDDDRPVSQRTLANTLGLSRDVIRRVETEAHALLLAMPHVAGLAGWLDD